MSDLAYHIATESRNPFSSRFSGWRIGRLRIWPWVGFWEVKRFRMGTTLILHVGCAVVVAEGGES